VRLQEPLARFHVRIARRGLRSVLLVLACRSACTAPAAWRCH
jgi:hypothetical protein